MGNGLGKLAILRLSEVDDVAGADIDIDGNARRCGGLDAGKPEKLDSSVNTASR